MNLVLFVTSAKILGKRTAPVIISSLKYPLRGLITSTIDSMKELSQPLPPYLCKDASVYQVERENIFAKNWLYAGRYDRLQKQGDYLSITPAGYPINSKNYGTVQSGNQSLLKCQYHSWLFDSRDGVLKATPNFNYKFQSEQKKCLNLKKVNLEIFAEQFIFVNLIETKDKASMNILLHDLLEDIMCFPLPEYDHLESQNNIK